MIFKDGKILLGKRKGSFGAGEFAFPGGKLGYMESLEACARRETKEETGLEIDNVRFLRIYNFKHQGDPEHYLDVGLAADWKEGEPKLLEPDKCENWNWYDIKNLPEPLFGAIPTYIEAHKTGKNFFDA